MNNFPRRAGETAQKAGRRFESFWAKIFGVDPRPGSGNQWFARLDVADGSILWSLKFTDDRSIRLSKEQMVEVQRAISEQGTSDIPGLAFAIDGGAEVFVTLRAEDFLRLLTDDVKYVTPSRGDQKRYRAMLPELLRDED